MVSRKIAIVAMAVALLGLASAGPGQSQSSMSGTLVVGMPGTVEQIDPNYAVSSFSAQTVIANIYDQLAEYGSHSASEGYLVDDTSKVVGAIAASYQMPLGSKQITLRLRDGLTFHDGTPLDANAVKFMFDRIIDLQSLAYGYLVLTGAKSKDSFVVNDPKSLTVRLSAPNPLALKLLSLENVVAVNPKLIRAHASSTDPWARNWLAGNDAGSGPFRLEKLAPTSEVDLVRFDKYWKGPAKLQRVVIKIVPDAADRELSLARGALDFISQVPPKDIATLQKNAGVTVLSIPSRTMQILGLNATARPFNNAKVRQAICYAIPYDTIIKEVYRGYASRLRSALPAGMPTQTSEFGYETDLAKAKALLAEAGFPNGFSTSLAVRQGFEEDEETAVWIRSNLQKIGVNVDIESTPLGGFVTKGRAKQLPMYINTHAYWVNDPYYLTYFLYRTGGGSSFTGYSNPAVDQLIDGNMLSTDIAGRANASRRIQQLVMQDAPFCDLAQTNVTVAMRKNVHGYYYSFDATHLTRFYTMYKTP